MAGDEVIKLQRHLSLLREEYVKLQNRLTESEKKCSVALAQLGTTQADDSFVARLLMTVANLFDKELYSDLTVALEGRTIRAHRFVLSARSVNWGVPNLGDVDRLDLTDINQEIGLCLLKWVYTDQITLDRPDSDILQLVKLGKRFKLDSLMERCEKALLSSVNVSNCVRFYQTADEIGAETLKCHSSELISNHWDDFTSEDFAHMAAPLLFKMFKSKTEYPLHTAIRTQREDVVFLYLIEFDSQLPAKLNEVDNLGDLPLDLALKMRQESVAKTLVTHRANLNVTDHVGKTLLHRAVDRGDEFSATFLTEHGAAVDVATPLERETVLHSLAGLKGCEESKSERCASVGRIAKSLLSHGANPNLQDSNGDTPLHRAISSKNEPVFKVLLEQSSLNLELTNADNLTVLWLALLNGDLSDGGFASQLVKKGSSVDAINSLNGEGLLHVAAKQNQESAGIFLANHGAKVNLANSKGECPLHIACSQGLSELVTVLLNKGANPNLQTAAPDITSPFTYNEVDPSLSSNPCYLQTPLHLAILSQKEDAVQAIINHKNNARNQAESLLIVPNFNLKNSIDETPLALALKCSLHSVAQQLLAGGANINVSDSQGSTMLHRAILEQDSRGALFLIESGADITLRTRDDESPLQLAVKRHLPVVVEALCVNGADLNVKDSDNNTPLWVALESGQEDVASILVKYGCDTDCWGEGPGGCQQTLLHRAIDENNESVACFLIRSGCDVDTSRKPGLDGQCEEEGRDGQSPLHLCGAWGLESVVQCLIEHNANVNIQDSEGKAPIHVAISNQHPTIISLLLSHPGLDLTLRDKGGLTPFAAAMTTRNNKAAEAILARTPNAAEQYDTKGRNFLHLAIQKSDIESVLFLLSINVNIHSRLKDSSQLTPLHLAVESNAEIIMRNLLLAGANINDRTPQKQTALHLAALKDHSTLCSILIENNVDFDAVDTNMNNALHVACQKGNLASCRVLLTESGINAEAVNLRGQNPVHVLCQYGKENAATILDLFTECMPKYPIGKPDAEGNSPLLLAYINGNGNLCRSIVRAGACVGACNRNGVNIFNFQVATKQLLFRLLDYLSQEPPWCDGDQCMQCEGKFGITTRKHHCRHCGRVLCSKCSERDIPILKYGLNKPVRVCEMCFDVLTLGTSS